MFNEVIRHSGDIKMVVWYLKLEWNVLNCIHNNSRRRRRRCRVCVCVLVCFVCDANVNTAQQIARWRQWNKQVINPKYYNNNTTTTITDTTTTTAATTTFVININITTINNKKERKKTGCKRKKVAERQFLADNIVNTTFSVDSFEPLFLLRFPIEKQQIKNKDEICSWFVVLSASACIYMNASKSMYKWMTTADFEWKKISCTTRQFEWFHKMFCAFVRIRVFQPRTD